MKRDDINVIEIEFVPRFGNKRTDLQGKDDGWHWPLRIFFSLKATTLLRPSLLYHPFSELLLQNIPLCFCIATGLLSQSDHVQEQTVA